MGYLREASVDFVNGIYILTVIHFSNAQLDSVIAVAVRSVGHSCGRKTMQGLLYSKGIRVGLKVMSIGCSILQIMQQAMVKNFTWIKMK